MYWVNPKCPRGGGELGLERSNYYAGKIKEGAAEEANSTPQADLEPAVQEALDAGEIPPEGITMTSIRHIAFRPNLEEAPEWDIQEHCKELGDEEEKGWSD